MKDVDSINFLPSAREDGKKLAKAAKIYLSDINEKYETDDSLVCETAAGWSFDGWLAVAEETKLTRWFDVTIDYFSIAWALDFLANKVQNSG